MSRTQLYRHFDKDGKLLYIGISLCTIGRLSQHRRNSRWFPLIARIDIENFETRAEAEAAEVLAIRRECPIYNVQNNDDNDAWFDLILADLRSFYHTKKYPHVSPSDSKTKKPCFMFRRGTFLHRVYGNIGSDEFHAVYAKAYIESDPNAHEIFINNDIVPSCKKGTLTLRLIGGHA